MPVTDHFLILLLRWISQYFQKLNSSRTSVKRVDAAKYPEFYFGCPTPRRAFSRVGKINLPKKTWSGNYKTNPVARSFDMTSCRNALRSTGPRTDGGNLRISRTAYHYGMTAKTVIISPEDANDYKVIEANDLDRNSTFPDPDRSTTRAEPRLLTISGPSLNQIYVHKRWRRTGTGYKNERDCN